MLIFALVVSLALIMYLISKKFSLGGAILIGSLLLALLAGLSPVNIIAIFSQTLTNRQTLELIISVYLIGILGSMMLSFGVMDIMIEHLEKTFRSVKLLLFIIPSLLSTFSVSGSAVFAAPVIDALGDRVGITKERKAAINLYIRHAWYFVLPISSSILYAAYLAEVPVWDLIRFQAPVSAAALVTAYLVYIHPLKDEKIDVEQSRAEGIIKSLIYTSPLIITLLLVIWFPFYIALIAGCFVTFLVRKRSGDYRKILFAKQNLNMVFAATAIMVFKGIIANIPGIGELIEKIINQGMPLEVILLVLPLILGYILANPQALIGMLFPILLPLVPPDQVLATAALINGIGFVTYFISPLHLCQALTNEYFCVSAKDLYKEYKITVPAMLISVVIYYFIMR